MFDNPFTPTFGGKPDFFFGREDILSRFEQALGNRGSADRALFITGNRGCGKTALLEQLSLRAAAAGRRVEDINSENALQILTRRLVRMSSSTKELSPELEVNVLGSGARLSGISSSQTVTYAKEDFAILFCEACERADKGIFITIDEVQKIDLDDLSIICGAFQMASRKGHDVMLAVAGLPYAHETVIQHEGCTYMRRAAHVPLSVFTRMETIHAVNNAFGRIDGLSLTDQAAARLVQASFGHPYLIQLIGYSLINLVNARSIARPHAITEQEAEASLPEAIQDYEVRGLQPILSALSPAEHRFLEALALTIGTSRTAKTALVAERLGKTTGGVAFVRQGLLNQGIIISPAHGELMFNMPYLRDYVLKQPTDSREAQLALDWGF